MRTDFFFKSGSGARLHGCRWTPDSQVRAVLQIVHGIAEYVERYDGFANFLNRQGILVVAEDHMGHGKSISQECPQGYFAGGWQTAVDVQRRPVYSVRPFHGLVYGADDSGKIPGQRHYRRGHLWNRLAAGSGFGGWQGGLCAGMQGEGGTCSQPPAAGHGFRNL